MKIKKKLIKIPTAKFGLELIGNIAESLPEATSLLTSPFLKSTATTGGEAAVLSVLQIASGAATGAKIGSIAGPMGAAIGAIGGAAVGLVGKKGDEAEMTSFTDYDEGTLGTGLIGAFTNKKLRKERKRVKMNAYNNRAAVQGTEYLANEYDMNYGDMNTGTFAIGGVVPSNLVYADDGELIKTPDGDINKIPEQGKPTDSNLLNLPEGSRILSNTLKVPGTKDTFAKAGEKIMKKKSKSKYTDKYAENSLMLNDMNNLIAYDNLFELQELVKAKKGIKPKTKLLIPAAEYGWDEPISNYTFIGKDKYSDPSMSQYMTNREWLLNNPDSQAAQKLLVDINSGKYGSIGNNTVDFEIFPRLSMDGKQGPVHNAVMQFKIPDNVKWRTPASDSLGYDWQKEDPLNQGLKSNWLKYGLPPSIDYTLDIDDYNPEVNSTEQDIDPENYKNKKKFPWDKVINGLSGIAEISPALSNLFTGKPKNIEANYNPYTNAILNAARGRRYNINPALRDIERNRAISNYNASQVNTNTSAGMAFRLANAVNTDKAISDIRAQESNVNNQYLGEYANIANNLGQQWVGATNLAEDLNRKSYANARNIRRQGLSQLSQWVQNRKLMRNQTSRDNALLNLYAPFLEGVFTNEDIKNYAKWIKKGGNSWE